MVRQPHLVQHRIHKVSGAIACKRTPCAVRSVSAGREPYNLNPRLLISESGQWLRPVLLIDVSATLYPTDVFAVLAQARTLLTPGDVVMQRLQHRQLSRRGLR